MKYLAGVPIIKNQDKVRQASLILQGLIPRTNQVTRKAAREYLDATYNPRNLPSVYRRKQLNNMLITSLYRFRVKVLTIHELMTDPRYKVPKVDLKS